MHRILPFLLALCVASAITTAQIGGGFGLQRGLTNERFDQLVRERSTARNLVNDGIPRVAVRFDDGRDGPWDNGHIAAFLRRGLPVSLAVNASTITSASAGNATPLGTNAIHLTWAVIRHLSDYARQHGTTLSVANHTYSTWGGAPWANGYAEYLRELQPDSIEVHTGIRPQVFVYTGDSKTITYMKLMKDQIAATLDSMGYIGAITGGSADSSGFGPMYLPQDVAQEGVTSVAPSVHFVRPGAHKDPFYLPAGMGTMDLGIMTVERSGNEAFSNTSAWTMRTSGGGDVNSESNWGRSFVVNYELRIANGCGFIAVMHDSVDTDGDSYNITNLSAAEEVGAFSPEHVAGVLKELHDFGLIKVVSIEEWVEWAMSSYAPGTNLVANPKNVVASWAIGDTAGVEVGWNAGWGAPSWQGASWSAGAATAHNMDGGLGNSGKFTRSADDPDDCMGADEIGFLGQPWGYNPPASARVRFLQGMLRPGRYRLVIPWTNANTTWGFREFSIAAAARWYRPSSLIGGLATGDAYGDSVIVYRYVDQDVTVTTPTTMASQWVPNFVDFTLPNTPLWVAGDQVNTLGKMYGSVAEQTTNFTRLWHDEFLWSVTWEGAFGGSPNQRMGPIQLRYLGPIN